MPLPVGYHFMMSHIADARVDLLINDSNTNPPSRSYGRRKLIDFGPEVCKVGDTERESSDQSDHTDIVNSSDTSDDQYGGEEDASTSNTSTRNDDDADTTDGATEPPGAQPPPQPLLFRTIQHGKADDSTGTVPTAQTAARKKRRQKLQRRAEKKEQRYYVEPCIVRPKITQRNLPETKQHCKLDCHARST